MTQSKLNASRANGRKSHGPITSAGKNRVSQNALKTGIYAQSAVIAGEDPEQLAQLTRDYYIDFTPRTSLMRDILDKVIHESWRSQRIARGETKLWDYALSKLNNVRPEHGEAAVLFYSGDKLDRARRMYDSSNHLFYRHVDRLCLLDSEPIPETDDSAPISTESSTSQSNETTGQTESVGSFCQTPAQDGPPADQSPAPDSDIIAQ